MISIFQESARDIIGCKACAKVKRLLPWYIGVLLPVHNLDRPYKGDRTIQDEVITSILEQVLREGVRLRGIVAGKVNEPVTLHIFLLFLC